jgi:hypothetical protein
MNFNKALVGLDGIAAKETDDKDLTVGRVLAGRLISASRGDALKMFSWAQKLYNGKALDLDKSDIETLKEFVKNDEQLTVLAKAQILMVLLEESK